MARLPMKCWGRTGQGGSRVVFSLGDVGGLTMHQMATPPMLMAEPARRTLRAVSHNPGTSGTRSVGSGSHEGEKTY